MEDRTIIFLGIALVGFLISSLSVRFFLSVIISICTGCILLYYPMFSLKEILDGHNIEKAWMVICFGLLPVVITAGVGCCLGTGVRILTSKTKMPVLFLWIAITLVIFIAGYSGMSLITSKRAIDGEQQLAEEFVKQNTQKLHQEGGDGTVSFYSSMNKVSSVGPNKPIYYFISLHQTKPVYAIVDVSRNSGKPIFTLSCIKHVRMVDLDPHKHPCQQ